MPPLSSLAKRSETGLLTPDNCLVAFIDLQPRMLAGVADADRQCVLHRNLMLAKAARLFGVPALLSCVDTPASNASMLAPLQAIFAAQAPLTRTSMNSWDDPAFIDAVVGLGRTRLILAGLWTATCVALPAIEALADGYDVYIVEDCCGDISALAHENAMQRMIQAGAQPVTAMSVMLEWQRDWALLDTSEAIRDIARAHSGAHGAALEHAAGNAYKPPQPVYPGYVGQAGN
jgi:nicotinamidase-related amidase